MTAKLNITAPDDLHCHLREGALLQAVIAHTAKNFRRAIIMPNLKQPIICHDDAIAYRKQIEMAMERLGMNTPFTPLMTLYLTDESDAADLKHGFLAGEVAAAKLYPAHATTNSSHGVTDVGKLNAVFKTMSDIGMPLLIHGEVTDHNIDIFDREAVFIDRILKPLREKFPNLKIVLEHITTKQAVDYVGAGDEYIAATITPHHMIINRNALFQGGLRPHHYCLPIAKREIHRIAVHDAALSGSKKFFAGTDSAPHPIGDKEKDCGCAGIFNSFQGPALYADIFDKAGGLHHLEGFLSHHGADFYGLKRNQERITLIKQDMPIPDFIEVKEYPATGEHPTNGQSRKIRPFMAGENLSWQIEDII